MLLRQQLDQSQLQYNSLFRDVQQTSDQVNDQQYLSTRAESIDVSPLLNLHSSSEPASRVLTTTPSHSCRTSPRVSPQHSPSMTAAGSSPRGSPRQFPRASPPMSTRPPESPKALAAVWGSGAEVLWPLSDDPCNLHGECGRQGVCVHRVSGLECESLRSVFW